MTQQFLGEIKWLGAINACSDNCDKQFGAGSKAPDALALMACFAQCNLSSGTPPVAPPGGVTLPQGWTLPAGWTLPSGLPLPAGATVPGIPTAIPPGFTLPTSLPLPADWKLPFPWYIPAGTPLPTPPPCPAGTMWLQVPGLPGACVPTSPPAGWFPPGGMPTSQPTQAAIACATECEKKFGVSATGGFNPAELTNCLAKCAGGQPQPQPPPPQQPPAAAASKDSTGWLVVAAIGVAVLGGIALMVGGRGRELALNPKPPRLSSYGQWITEVAELMFEQDRAHEYSEVNVAFWRSLYSAGYTPAEAVKQLDEEP